MADSSSNSRLDIIEQTAAWHARLSAEDVTSDDWQEFKAWLNQDTAHREVFESMGQMSAALRELGDDSRLQALHDSAPATASVSGDSQVRAIPATKRRRSWQMRPRHMALAAGVLAALIVPLLYFMAEQEVPEQTNYRTAIGERQTIALNDGSSLFLNADTNLGVTFAVDERQVVLRRGEVFFDVAAKGERPFIVEVGDNDVTVLGTSFDIRFRNDPARVTVHEGLVRVAPDSENASGIAEVQLGAGQQLDLRPGAVPVDVSQEELSKLSDWRNGWLHFDNRSLAEVVQELDPYIEKQVILTSRRVGQLEVGGSFNVDNVDSLLVALESLLPIEITHESDRIIVRHESDP